MEAKKELKGISGEFIFPCQLCRGVDIRVKISNPPCMSLACLVCTKLFKACAVPWILDKNRP